MILVEENKKRIKIKDRFGRLIVRGEPFWLRNTSKDKERSQYCVLTCDCGKIIIREIKELLKNKHRTQSCGCFKKNKRLTDYELLLHRRWNGIINRCYNKNSSRYYLYGGRGIKVSKEFRDINKFTKWALKNGFRPELTIDRRNNNGNYCRSNCRWVDDKTQANNKRNNRKYKYKNRWYTIKQLSQMEECKVSCAILTKNLKQDKTIEEAFVSKPKRKRCPKIRDRMIYRFGESKSLSEWAKDPRVSIRIECLCYRARCGWSDIDILTIPICDKELLEEWIADKQTDLRQFNEWYKEKYGLIFK